MEQIDPKEIMAQSTLRELELQEQIQAKSLALAKKTVEYEKAMLALEQQSVALQQARQLLGLAHEESQDENEYEEEDEEEEENEYGQLAVAATNCPARDLDDFAAEAERIRRMMFPMYTAAPYDKRRFMEGIDQKLQENYHWQEINSIIGVAKALHENEINEKYKELYKNYHAGKYQW